MPDFAAHRIFGEQLLPAPGVQELLAGPRELAPWLWGLQGPDPLFFLGKTAPLGSRMHQGPPEELFQALAARLRRFSGPARDTAAAWLGGFFAHYILDRTVHPYVLAKVEELPRLIPGATGNALHYQVETDMDADLYLLTHRAPVTSARPCRGMELEPWQREVLGEMFAAGAAGCRRYLAREDAVRALDRTAFTQGLIFRGGKPLRAAARGAEVLSGRRGQLTGHMKGPRPRWDSLNLSQAPWTDPRDGARRTQSVPALLDAARRDYLSLLPALRAAMASPSPLPLGGVDHSGRR